MRRLSLLALLAGALAARPAAAQPNAPPLPHPVLLTAFPCGVQAGHSVDIALGGIDLDGAGQKGQRVLAHCQTSSVDSRLEAALELYDAAGRRLAFNRRYCENDALLDATLPADGDYHLRVFGFTYTRGDAQHFYRLTLTAGPWVDA